MRLHEGLKSNAPIYSTEYTKSMIIWGAYGSYGCWEDPQEEVGIFRHVTEGSTSAVLLRLYDISNSPNPLKPKELLGREDISCLAKNLRVGRL